MSNVTRRALRVYSALAELRGQGDVLDALIPFFEPILALTHGKIFDPRVFAVGVRKLYGWRFTEDIAHQFIPRLRRHGHLQEEGTPDKRIYIVNFPSNANPDADHSIVAAVEGIIDEFEKFPPRVTDLLSYKKSREELKDLLIRFLVSMDDYGAGAYSPEFGGMEPGGEARSLLANLEEGGRPLDPNDRYMCARFVQHLVKSRKDYLPHLTRLASIALLTEVVADFLKPTTADEKADLTVALDAPLALDLLGCSGRAPRDDIKTIVDALSNVGVNFIVFPISCVEMQRNLSSMLSLPSNMRSGYTHNALLKGEISLDFVTAVANNAERALTNIGVTVRPLDLNSFPAFHRLFTGAQYEDFFQSIMWVGPVGPREHDATCTALVMRLREGRQSTDVFKSRYVLATRNGRFVRDSRRYCLESRMITAIQSGPVIHHRELATLAWLRTGLGADDAVPRSHLIATCDRVLRIRPEVRQALALQLAKLTPDRIEQFNTLMLDSRSIQKLADQTLNDEKVVTADNAQELLRVIREATAEEEREKYEAALESQRSESNKITSELGASLNVLKTQLETETTRANEHARKFEALIVQAASRTNTMVDSLDSILNYGLIGLGFIAIVDYFYQFLANSRLWAIVGLAAAAFGLYRLIWAVREVPTKGLRTVLGKLAAWDFHRRLRGLGISSRLDTASYELRDGRIKVNR